MKKAAAKAAKVAEGVVYDPQKPPSNTNNPFAWFTQQYFDNPGNFVTQVMGATPDPWQLELMEAVNSGERRISVRSGHGVGKSTALAWVVLWYMCTRKARIILTAPSTNQLFDALFAELGTWYKKLPASIKKFFNVTSDRIEFIPSPEELFVSARTARPENPDALQGIHAKWVLLIVDEASGVHDGVFLAAGGSMSGERACMIMSGNPVRSSGYFFESHTRLRHSWKTMVVDGTCVKVLAWYDNEIGYVHRMIELAEKVGASL